MINLMQRRGLDFWKNTACKLQFEFEDLNFRMSAWLAMIKLVVLSFGGSNSAHAFLLGTGCGEIGDSGSKCQQPGEP